MAVSGAQLKIVDKKGAFKSIQIHSNIFAALGQYIVNY